MSVPGRAAKQSKPSCPLPHLALPLQFKAFPRSGKRRRRAGFSPPRKTRTQKGRRRKRRRRRRRTGSWDHCLVARKSTRNRHRSSSLQQDLPQQLHFSAHQSQQRASVSHHLVRVPLCHLASIITLGIPYTSSERYTAYLTSSWRIQGGRCTSRS